MTVEQYITCAWGAHALWDVCTVHCFFFFSNEQDHFA